MIANKRLHQIGAKDAPPSEANRYCDVESLNLLL